MKRIRKYEGNSLVLKRSREKKWRDANRSKGLCSCGEITANDKKRCNKCIINANARRKERRNLRKLNKTCTECATPTNGKNLCDKCKELHKLFINKIKQERIEKKVCVRCGKNAAIHDLQNCIICTLKSLAFDIWNDRKRWQDLLDLFNKQNGICPYFKEPIEIGLNAALDHKVPKKLGGSNDISNLQWVHKIANTMKWDLIEEEFYIYIKKLYESHMLNNCRRNK